MEGVKMKIEDRIFVSELYLYNADTHEKINFSDEPATLLELIECFWNSFDDECAPEGYSIYAETLDGKHLFLGSAMTIHRCCMGV